MTKSTCDAPPRGEPRADLFIRIGSTSGPLLPVDWQPPKGRTFMVCDLVDELGIVLETNTFKRIYDELNLLCAAGTLTKGARW